MGKPGNEALLSNLIRPRCTERLKQTGSGDWLHSNRRDLHPVWVTSKEERHIDFFWYNYSTALTLSRFVRIPCNNYMYTYNMTLCICSLFNMIYIVCAILSGLFLYLTISRVQHLSTKNLWSKALLHGKKKRNRILDHGTHTQ